MAYMKYTAYMAYINYMLVNMEYMDILHTWLT